VNKVEYMQGADLPDLALSWYDSNNNLIDFSTGYTFELKVGNPGETALITKTTGITGGAASPNVTVSWSTAGELNALAAGSYRGQLRAQRGDGKQRYMTFLFEVNSGIL
jgi:hypothetical protein